MGQGPFDNIPTVTDLFPLADPEPDESDEPGTISDILTAPARLPPPGAPGMRYAGIRHDTLRELNTLPGEVARADAKAQGVLDMVSTIVQCRECLAPIEYIGRWRPPTTADQAWGTTEGEEWRRRFCHASIEEDWSMCCRTGISWIRGDRVDFERRGKGPHPGAEPWDRVEHRRKDLTKVGT